MPALIEAQARQSPTSVAVQEGDRQLTFAELVDQSGHLARTLLSSSRTVDRPIAAILPMSIDLVVAELAILRAGAAVLRAAETNSVKRVILSPSVLNSLLNFLLEFIRPSHFFSGFNRLSQKWGPLQGAARFNGVLSAQLASLIVD